MHSHAVLLPVVTLVNSAGVGVRLLISQWSPDEAAQICTDQANIASSAVVMGHISDSVRVGAAHQPAVLPILTVRSRDLIGGRELTVHPNISLQVSETWKHLRPTRREQKC